MLRDDINNALKDAMKAQDERARLDAAAGQFRASRTPTSRRAGRASRRSATTTCSGVLQKMIKQRQESVELYEKGGRDELADQEREEIAIISAYLPKQMSDDEMAGRHRAAMQENRASRHQGHGQGDRRSRSRYAGQMDFGKASAPVKKLLAEPAAACVRALEP